MNTTIISGRLVRNYLELNTILVIIYTVKK